MTEPGGGGPSVVVVVVADADDLDELTRALAAVSLSVAWCGDGGDETLRRLVQDPPEVVVLAAHLERGDARSFATALRRDATRELGLVLVGETDGPVRNALDALDYDVDRFVGRPLAPKALRFAVRAALPGRRRLSTVPPGPALDERLAAATDTAIDAFIADAMDALPLVTQRPARAATEGRVVRAAPHDPAVADTPVVDMIRAPTPEPVGESTSGGWVAPAAPAREPTLILPDGGVSAARDAGPARSPEGEPAKPAAPDAIDGIYLAAYDAGDSEPGAPAAVPEPEPPAAAPPPSSDLGRELRAKMSQMAERLFPGRADTAAGLQVGLVHDPHDEIDLAALGVETVTGVEPSEPGPYPDMAHAESFSGAGSDSGGGDAGSRPQLRGEIDVAEDRTGTGTTGVGSDGGTGEHTFAREPGGERPRRRRASTVGPTRGEIGPRDEDVAALMARMYRARFTGQLAFRRHEAEKVVHFEHGRPVFASSNLPHDRMGDLLYREGKITRTQHAESRELVAESGRRMGEVLVERGFLKRRELLPAVRRHIEDVVYSLYGWDSGGYAITRGDAAPGEKIRLSRHPAALVVEGIRRKYGLDALEARLGRDDAVVALRDGQSAEALVKDLDLGTAERRVIELLDGERPLAEIPRRSGADTLAVYQLAYGLVVLGAADAIAGAADPELMNDEGRPPSLVGATDLAIDRQRVLAKHSHVEDADYFMLLGVRREASGFEIRRAYEAARRDYATEAFPAPVRRELAAEIAEIAEVLDEAYQVLIDDSLRKRYKTNLRD